MLLGGNRMIINLNVNNSIEVHKVNSKNRYSDICDIIVSKLNGENTIALRNTEDYNIAEIINSSNLDVSHFEFEDDVLYIR